MKIADFLKSLRVRKAKCCAYLDISANSMNMARAVRLIGVRPTHYYTPRTCSSKPFRMAKLSAPDEDRYCLQYRTRHVHTHGDDAGAELIFRRLNHARKGIRAVISEYSARAQFCVYIDRHGEPEVYRELSPEIVEFCAAIGAKVGIYTM